MKLDCKEIGMTMLILNGSDATDGKSLDMEWELAPLPDGPPVHIHPNAVETYEILDGEMEIYIDGEWVKAQKGDKLKVEIGQPHTFRNNSGRPARVYNTHQPAMNFEGFFKGLYNLSESGFIKNGKMSFKGILGISTLYSNYSDEIVSVKPPAFMMKLLSLVGKTIGINFK